MYSIISHIVNGASKRGFMSAIPFVVSISTVFTYIGIELVEKVLKSDNLLVSFLSL